MLLLKGVHEVGVRAGQAGEAIEDNVLRAAQRVATEEMEALRDKQERDMALNKHVARARYIALRSVPVGVG